MWRHQMWRHYNAITWSPHNFALYQAELSDVFFWYFREDIPKSGATLSDLIMNTSTVLTPMFNLGKARRESTQRKEKYNTVIF